MRRPHRHGSLVEVWIDFSPALRIGSLRAGIIPANGAKAAPSYPSFPAWATIRALQAGRTSAAPKNVLPPRRCLPAGVEKSGWSGERHGRLGESGRNHPSTLKKGRSLSAPAYIPRARVGLEVISCLRCDNVRAEISFMRCNAASCSCAATINPKILIAATY
jgi:hypothetical protein